MDTQTNQDIEIVQIIQEILTPISQESREGVIGAVIALMHLRISNSLTTPPGNNNQLSSEISIKEFIELKQPTKNPQRLACLAYYLREHTHKIDLTAKDLREASYQAGIFDIPDFAQSFSDADLKFGLFKKSSGDKRRLTPRGTAVVNALPDQKKVNAILQKISYTRSTVRKKAAKGTRAKR